MKSDIGFTDKDLISAGKEAQKIQQKVLDDYKRQGWRERFRRQFVEMQGVEAEDPFPSLKSPDPYPIEDFIASERQLLLEWVEREIKEMKKPSEVKHGMVVLGARTYNQALKDVCQKLSKMMEE